MSKERQNIKAGKNKEEKLNVDVDTDKEVKEEQEKDFEYGIALYHKKGKDGRNAIDMEMLAGKQEKIQFSELVALLESAKFELFSNMFGNQLTERLTQAGRRKATNK